MVSYKTKVYIANVTTWAFKNKKNGNEQKLDGNTYCIRQVVPLGALLSTNVGQLAVWQSHQQQLIEGVTGTEKGTD